MNTLCQYQSISYLNAIGYTMVPLPPETYELLAVDELIDIRFGRSSG